MPAGGSRRGRRDNGLSAAEYAAVGDVDPRVGEHLLDVLAGEGIAAYLLPATDLHPVTRTTTLPARPTDRLYADRERLATARDYLARLRADENAAPVTPPDTAPSNDAAGPVHDSTTGTGTTGTADLDAAWASIVAAYDAEVDTATAPWPEAENISARDLSDTDPELGQRLGLDTGKAEAADGTGDRSGQALDRPVRRTPDEPTLLDALDTFGADVPDDNDEGYTPPPPPPVPRPPAPVVLALVGIVSGLLLFFKPELLPIDADVALLLGFGALLAGVITLIWRLRPGDEEEDPDDDGAVV
ncbi:DUF308 domain-containing protein [Planosporangium flavigriseum]|uniref:DUF308 domain-containing protein n=1 Tax=Planosporangium flavigriseum TaxID=373681 RepID=A0A8J3LL37_9ACTN|nr:DUF308 domain-containing protein [Planosporangium flavigriseum]NJC63271.1 DUF308 domain-containing protein [Planosporangium flavigriseum]GIG72545.1 hypothetical protein Pfl04_09490 [Planosporangium flavigriseum]